MTSGTRTVVCLVGSVNQEADWRFYAQALTKRGFVVFEAGAYDKTATPATWETVTKVHQRKIELSNIVAIIKKPNGTIGTHTLADIDYARKRGKQVLNAEELLDI